MYHISPTDNYWFLDPIDCDVYGMSENNCILLINAFNGRALYVGVPSKVNGGKPSATGKHVTWPRQLANTIVRAASTLI